MILRVLLVLLAVCAILAGLVLYRYGSLDPCRVLAQDMADDTVAGLEETFGPEYEDEYAGVRSGAERLTRFVTSQYDAGDCVRELRTRWFGD